VTVRGQGTGRTILDFSAATDAQAFLARGDEFLIHDLKIWDPPGDGVKAENVDGATVRRVWVEWPNAADPNNGPYGIYPVSSQNVLVEYCYIKGAEDTGIYVGQSDHSVIRFNYLEGNVAGIEIENTTHADVHHNITTGNTAGILVFNDPGIARFGHTARVYENWIYDNNGPNFGSSPLLTLVPPGIGILVMSMDHVEIFENDVFDNQTSGIALISFELTLLPYPDGWDVWPETLHVHDNRMDGNSDAPQTTIGQVIALQFGALTPDIWWDRIRDPDLGLASDEVLPDDLRVCVHDNLPSPDGDPVWGILGASALPGADRYDLAPFDCVHPPEPETVLRERLPLPEGVQELSPEETAALCGAATLGVNWSAFEASCPMLSDYHLFETGDPRGPASERGVLYELTTPLFSDYANKYRFVFVPPGQSAGYDDQAVFDFPVGTIVSKTFAFDVPGGGEQVVETRLLIHRASGWKALVYLWDAAMTEAVLVPGGAIVPLDVVVTDGSQRSIVYEVPDVNQCGGCHTGFGQAMHLIGPKARLLNRPDPGDTGGTTNQLATWYSLGILDQAVDPALEPRLPVWDDPADGTLGERARAYLESNCAHCHRPDGRASFTNLWLNIEQPEDFNLGLCKHPIAAGSGAGGLDFDIVPGDPDASILVFRMESAEPAVEMPELAKATVHDEGAELVRAWIQGLPGSCATE
jgi:parallel beta-helix repeat protein